MATDLIVAPGVRHLELIGSRCRCIVTAHSGEHDAEPHILVDAPAERIADSAALATGTTHPAAADYPAATATPGSP